MLLQIRRLRVEHHMTQQQLADRMGVVRNAITNWENGLSSPRTNQIPVLADVFGCTIDELYGRNPPDQSSA